MASERLSEELLDVNRRLLGAQQEVVQARSISMIAAMAAGAAHELNNPLSVVSGRAQMELARCEDAESAQALRIMIEQTRRATQIVSDLMQFAKPAPPKPLVQPLVRVLEPLCQHWGAGSSLGDQRVTLSLADPEATVYADPLQLREILNALMANAVEAVNPETAHVHINSRSHASDETVRIVVEDNGVGMTRDVLEHAFDPLFSSRPAGRSRGLGLPRAYRFAQINGGRLWLVSKPNVGTTATLELPAKAPNS
jgi:signal transduction histidine kinase